MVTELYKEADNQVCNIGVCKLLLNSLLFFIMLKDFIEIFILIVTLA